LEDDGLRFEPRLPAGWETLRFRVQWHGREVGIRLERASRLFTATLEAGGPMRVCVGSQAETLELGQSWHTHWSEPPKLHALDPAA